MSERFQISKKINEQSKGKMSKQHGQNNSKRRRDICLTKWKNIPPHLEDKKYKLETMSRYYLITTKLSKTAELKIPAMTMAQSMNIPALQMEIPLTHFEKSFAICTKG